MGLLKQEIVYFDVDKKLPQTIQENFYTPHSGKYQRKGLTIVRIFGAEKLSIFLIGKFLSRLLNLSLVGLLLIIAPNNPGKLLYPPFRQCIFENSLF